MFEIGTQHACTHCIRVSVETLKLDFLCGVCVCEQDAFKDGNVVQLLTRSKGFPIQIKGATVYGDGAFGHDQSKRGREEGGRG